MKALGWLALVPLLFAASAPEWVRYGKKNDATFRYYIGRSHAASDESQAFKEAGQDAYEQAIRENFGFHTRIRTEAYESNTQVVSTKRSEHLSQEVQLNGFEQVDFYKNEAQDLWVLFRYPESEILREKTRLAGRPSKQAPLFSESGTIEAGQKGGVLEVQTEPAGAKVWVDGESYGVTPVRLRGVLSPGQHRLRLDDPAFDTVDEAIILVPGKTTEIKKALVPAQARLSVTSTPSGAELILDGKRVGITPVSDLKVPVHKDLKLRLVHPEADPLSVSFQAAKDEFNVRHFDLPLKNATLVIRSTPMGAEVAMDGKVVGHTPVGPRTVSAGKHQIEITKAGFQSERLDLILRGGEKRVLEGVKLEPAQVGREPTLWKELNSSP